MEAATPPRIPPSRRPLAAFLSTVRYGLSRALPPLVTVVLLLWIWQTLDQHAIDPVRRGLRDAIVRRIVDIQPATPLSTAETTIEGRTYRLVEGPAYIPAEVVEIVRQNANGDAPPLGARAYYNRYVEITYLRPVWFIPGFLVVFAGVVYVLGRLVVVGLARHLGDTVEASIARLPLVRNVYSAAKHLTQRVLVRDHPDAVQVVAVEYPRRGIWAVGLVTADGLADVSGAAGERLVSIMADTSPVPFTGFTVQLKRSETIPLAMSVEEALHFIVSCGVVVPPQQARTPDFGTLAPPRRVDEEDDR